MLKKMEDCYSCFNIGRAVNRICYITRDMDNDVFEPFDLTFV